MKVNNFGFVGAKGVKNYSYVYPVPTQYIKKRTFTLGRELAEEPVAIAEIRDYE